MSGRATLSVLGALLVLSVALPASADKEQAAARFREAQAAYDAGDYATAARAFERAYSAEPHAAALYNAGVAWAVADKPARAASALERALAARSDLSKAEAADASARLESLRNHLAILEIKVRDGDVALVDGEPALTPTAFVEPGLHKVSARRANGETVEPRAVDVRRGAVVPVDLSSAPAATGATAPDGRGADRLRTAAGYGLFGLSAVAVVSTTVFGLKTLAAKDDLEASGLTDAEARDRAVSSKTLANVSLVVAIAAAAGGAVLLFVLPKTERRAGLYLAPTGALVRGSF